MRDFSELVGGLRLPPPREDETHGTTVLALRYDQGVVMLSDRRATAGNLIMYDQADKVIALDDTLLMAIAGAFARAIEAARFLRHNLKYYRRVVQQDMSQEGKLNEISRAIAGNAGAAAAGMGLFLPIVASHDPKAGDFRVYFFDGAGARFENGEYACAGSGSERIRGVFEYLRRTKGPFSERGRDEVIQDGLAMLDIAADLDSATGGFDKVRPIIRTLDADGVRSFSPEEVDEQTRRLRAPR